jgi:hypothetical protein
MPGKGKGILKGQTHENKCGEDSWTQMSLCRQAEGEPQFHQQAFLKDWSKVFWEQIVDCIKYKLNDSRF